MTESLASSISRLGSRLGPHGTWLLGLFLGGLAWRLVHLYTVRHSPLFQYLFIDPRMYDEWAARIAGGQLLGDSPFFIDPLYPYFVAAVYACLGHSTLAVAVIQSVLGAIVAPLVFAAARPWFDRPVPHVAGLLAAFYPVSVFWGGALMKPALAPFAIAASLWFLSRALARGGPGNWFGAGGSMALGCLLRGSLLFVLPAIAVWIGAGKRASMPVPPTRRWREAAWFLGGAAAILALPAAHNYAVSGELVVATTNWGQIFFIGNHPDNPSGRFHELSFVRSNPAYEQTDFKHEAERRAGRPLGHHEVSRFWFGEALEWIRSHPLEWLERMGSKLRIYWGSYETPASLDYYLYRRHAPLLRFPLPGFGIVAPLALVGAVLAWPRVGWPRLLVIYVVSASLAAIAFFVLTRFRMVLMPALFVLAAHGAVELARRCHDALHGTGRTATLRALALLILGFVFVNLPVRATADSWSYRLASKIGLPTRLETTANAHFNLGVTFARVAQEKGNAVELLERAEIELRQALREESQPKMYVELGKVLARLERNAGAIVIYERARALEPRDYRIPHALGLLHRRVADLASAEDAFRLALQLEPRHAASAVQLGEVLLQRGRHGEAAEAFRAALRVRPDDAAARAGLAAAEAR